MVVVEKSWRSLKARRQDRRLIKEKQASSVAQLVKKPTAMQETACRPGDQGSIPAWEDPLEKGTATHSSILAWRIPCTEESGRLQSMGSQ